MTVVATTVTFAAASTAAAKKAGPGGGDITKIDHIVVLMQENRSFDHYFGLLHNEGQPHSSNEPKRGNPNPLAPTSAIPMAPGFDGYDVPETTLIMCAVGAEGSVVTLTFVPLTVVDGSR